MVIKCFKNHQNFIINYMKKRKNKKGLLIYHGLGSFYKTITSIGLSLLYPIKTFLLSFYF